MNSYLPKTMQIAERRQESPAIFTFGLHFSEVEQQKNYHFEPGQFNMLYLYGVGEVPISISSDPLNSEFIQHTVRAVGRVTKGLFNLKEGDFVGMRGPYGKGWPIGEMFGKNVIIITGGVGCAPATSAIKYIMQRRNQYKDIAILQGLKHSNDLFFQSLFEQWAKIPNTQVLLGADKSSKNWPWYKGRVTDLIDTLTIDFSDAVCLLCGPEIMMKIAAERLLAKGVVEEQIYLSMERNMQCAIKHCGHCQYAGSFVCQDGPIFCYANIKEVFFKPGI